MLLTSGEIWDLGELISPVCLLMFLFRWPHGSKTKHVRKYRYTCPQCRGASTSVWIDNEQYSSQCPLKPHQHSQLWTTQADLSFLHFIKERVPPLSFPPCPTFPWAIDMYICWSLKVWKPLAIRSSQSPSPCPGLCLSSLHFWHQLF